MPRQRTTSIKTETTGVEITLDALKSHASRKTLEEMSIRYGIVTKKAMGVPMGKIQLVAKGIGTNHALALKLWESGWYEARMLASLIDDIAEVTPAQMDRWVKDMDNWGIVDTVCFKLFDRAPTAIAFKKIDAWTKKREEFVRRAGVVLLACVALHDKEADDEPFLKRLALLERTATDERNFVRKGVSWALRALGMRSPGLWKATHESAVRLAASDDPTARSIGKEALRDLAKSKPGARQKAPTKRARK